MEKGIWRKAASKNRGLGRQKEDGREGGRKDLRKIHG